MAKPDLGNKRQCQSCSAKFFDLNKDPIVCPKCGAIFQVTVARSVARAAAASEEGEIEIDSAAELVPLEDADSSETAAVVIPDEDIEIEDEGEEDDTFLEEEEESDDVAGLIDGDIETDEES